MRTDIFVRLPPPTALLILANILDFTVAYDLSSRRRATHIEPTATLPHHPLDVVPYPPRPTSPPRPGFDLRRRQLNTVCGFIGGDPNLPATCSAGSHCVLDALHSAVGCCPDGDAVCTTGVFTGCVDGNSPPQTEVNPYVFTCGGSDVCYRNQFDGGFFQWGCGSASNLATSVFASATGIVTSLDRPSKSVSFTDDPTTLRTPTTIGSKTSTTGQSSSSSTTSTSTSSSSSSASSSSSSSTFMPTSSTISSSSMSTNTSIPTLAPANTGSGVDRTGAIVGGTISGAAILIALVAVGIWLWRRRGGRGGKRVGSPGTDGPPMGNNRYISQPVGAAGFAPLHQSHEGWETGMAPGSTAYVSPMSGGGYQQQSYPPPAGQGYHYPGRYTSAYAAGAGGGLARVGEEDEEDQSSDRVPLTRESEIDDFSRGFQSALDRIGPDEPYHTSSGESIAGTGAAAAQHGNDYSGNGYGSDGEGGGSSHNSGGGRPLWQQNRRQSRNLMWM